MLLTLSCYHDLATHYRDSGLVLCQEAAIHGAQRSKVLPRTTAHFKWMNNDGGFILRGGRIPAIASEWSVVAQRSTLGF